MNTPHTDPTTVQNTIDQALRQLGGVQPEPGMHDRILHRLQQAAKEPVRQPSAWSRLLVPGFRLAFAGLAGCCLCTAVVLGSLQHSHTLAAQNHPVVPVLPQQGGFATASSARIAAHPAVAPSGGRSNQHLGEGRATVKPGTHIHGGDAIPVPPRAQ